MPSTIKLNSRGTDVQLAQYELCRNLMLGGPPDVDGIFGPRTDHAVRAFQEDASLTVDGIVGPHTWSAMLSRYANPPTLKNGSHGAPVDRLQSFLNLSGANPQLAVDDMFGPKTESAVKHYQGANQVPADGIVGYKTWVIHIGAMNRMVASEVQV